MHRRSFVPLLAAAGCVPAVLHKLRRSLAVALRADGGMPGLAAAATQQTPDESQHYGGREIEGLRIRLRGVYGDGAAEVAGAGRLQLQERVVADGATQFSVSRIVTYAVIDLKAVR